MNPVPIEAMDLFLYTIKPKIFQNIINSSCFEGVCLQAPQVKRASPKSEPFVERHCRQPKVRPKYEPFAQNLSQSDQSLNPLLKMLAGALKA